MQFREKLISTMNEKIVFLKLFLYIIEKIIAMQFKTECITALNIA